MSARRRYLVGYDIRDPVRLRLVHKTTKAYGHRLQYSVYLCDLTFMEKYEFLGKLSDIIEHNADAIVFVDLGEAGGRAEDRFEFMGVRPRLPSGPAARIV